MIIRTESVGNQFRPIDCQVQFSTLQTGDKLNLELEPDNLHDQFAVKVISEGYHIGYIPRQDSFTVHHTLDQPNVEYSCEIVAWEQLRGGKRKPLIEIRFANKEAASEAIGTSQPTPTST